jgi:hypothetical protein
LSRSFLRCGHTPTAVRARCPDELFALRSALYLNRHDRADALRVVLAFDDVGLERVDLLGHEHVVVRTDRHGDRLGNAEHLGLVLGLARVVLLPVRVADLWLGRHDDAGLGTIHPGLPRTLGADDLAVLVLGALFTEIPDGAVGVLGEPVVRVLDDLAVEGDGVAHDQAGHAHHLARLVCDLHDGALKAVLGATLVHPLSTRFQWEIGVVHRGGERCRIDGRRVRDLGFVRAAWSFVILVAHSRGDDDASDYRNDGCGGERDERGARDRHGQSSPSSASPDSSSVPTTWNDSSSWTSTW